MLQIEPKCREVGKVSWVEKLLIKGVWTSDMDRQTPLLSGMGFYLVTFPTEWVGEPDSRFYPTTIVAPPPKNEHDYK